MISENKVINFSIGAAAGAVLALAMAVVAFDLAQLPKLWAYVFLGLIILVIIINIILLVRGDRLIARYCNLMSGNLSEVCALMRFTGGHAPQ